MVLCVHVLWWLDEKGFGVCRILTWTVQIVKSKRRCCQISHQCSQKIKVNLSWLSCHQVTSYFILRALSETITKFFTATKVSNLSHYFTKQVPPHTWRLCPQKTTQSNLPTWSSKWKVSDCPHYSAQTCNLYVCYTLFREIGPQWNSCPTTFKYDCTFVHLTISWKSAVYLGEKCILCLGKNGSSSTYMPHFCWGKRHLPLLCWRWHCDLQSDW